MVRFAQKIASRFAGSARFGSGLRPRGRPKILGPSGRDGLRDGFYLRRNSSGKRKIKGESVPLAACVILGDAQTLPFHDNYCDILAFARPLGMCRHLSMPCANSIVSLVPAEALSHRPELLEPHRSL